MTARRGPSPVAPAAEAPDEARLERLVSAMVKPLAGEERAVVAGCRDRLAAVVGTLRRVQAELCNIVEALPRRGEDLELALRLVGHDLEFDLEALDVSGFAPGQSIEGSETGVGEMMSRWANVPIGDELEEVIREVTTAMLVDEDTVRREVRGFLIQAGPEVREALAAHLGVAPAA